MSNLLFIEYSLEPYRRDFLIKLAEKNSDLNILTLKKTSTKIEGIDLYSLPFCSEDAEKRILADLLNMPWQIFYILRLRPKAIISGDIGIRTFISCLLGRFLDIKVVVWARLTTWTEKDIPLWKKYLRKMILKLSHQTITNGKSGQAYLSSLTDRVAKIVYQIPNDFTTFRLNQEFTVEKIANQEKTKFCFVGRITRLKGLIELIDSIHAVSKDRIELTVIGDGPHLKIVQDHATRSGIQAKFPGWLSDNEIAQELLNSDALIFPTLQDEWGMVIIEALHCGLPIIGSTKSGAVEELITDGVQGFTFNPLKKASLDHAISNFLEMSTLEKWQMREECLLLVKQKKLEPEEMAQEFQMIVDGIL